MDWSPKWLNCNGIYERRPSFSQLTNQWIGISPAYLSYMFNGKRPWWKDLKEAYDLAMKRGFPAANRAAKSGVAQSGRAPAWGVGGRPRIRRPHAIMLE